jgi:hypothetical protein
MTRVRAGENGLVPERTKGSNPDTPLEKEMEALDELLVEERRDHGANRVIRDAAPAEKFRQKIDRRALRGLDESASPRRER